MKIGINGFEAVVPRFGFQKDGIPNRVGSSEFCYQLLLHLSKIDKTNSYTIYLPVEPTGDMPSEKENWKYKVIKSPKLWTLLGLNKTLLTEKDLSVFFSPTHYAPLISKCPQVISILDVSYRRYSELFNKQDLYQLRFWGKLSVKKASRIITISESSKDDIIKEYRVKGEKITVVYPGMKELSREPMEADLLKKHSVSKPYILFVGTLQPRKNISRLIEAFSKIKRDGAFADMQLVVVGKRGWMFEEIESAPKKYGVQDSVRFIQDATNEDLPAFYKNAELFVLPSLYEGFGLPVIEAMSYECPVVTSNISSLPEAGGDAAIYINPQDTSDIAEKITTVLNDQDLRKEMVQKGKEHIKKFSWEKSAREVLAVLEEVGNAR